MRTGLHRSIFNAALWSGCIAIRAATWSSSAAETSAVFQDPAAECIIDSWTTERGLPDNNVLAIAQSPDGYLWVATWNGLARFDGLRFVQYRPAAGLRSVSTRWLLEDRAGQLWIGTLGGGLTVLRGGSLHTFTRADGLPGEAVRGLTEDAEGGIWVALEGGLVRSAGPHFSPVTLPEARGTNAGCLSLANANGTVFALSEQHTIWEWRAGQWRGLPALNRHGHAFAQLHVTRSGALWSTLTPEGLAKLEGDHWQVFAAETGLPETFIWSLLERRDGTLLCGTYDRGLFILRDGRATPLKLSQRSQTVGVLALLEDTEGNLWAGTGGEGLVRVRPKRLRLVAGTESLRNSRVAFDRQGRLWFGGVADLLFEKDGLLCPIAKPGLGSVATLLPAFPGGVWIGSEGLGLWRMDPGVEAEPRQMWSEPKEAGSPSGVSALADDGAGGVWFGTHDGRLGHARGETINLLPPLEGIAGQRIAAMVVEPTGVLWVAGSGVHRIEEQRVVLSLTRREGLPIDSVRCLLVDRDGTLWIGSYGGGLCRWRENHLTVFDRRCALPDEMISGLIEDESPLLWCSGNTGLFRLDKRELDEIATGRATALHPLLLGRSEGLAYLAPAGGMTPNVIRGPKREFFFPMVDGVIALNPAQFNQRPEPPPVRVEEARIDGRPVELPAANTPLRVPPGSSQLDVRYTAIHFAAPETVRFRHRLEGVDPAWTEAGEQRVATFRRLPPGKYQFRVTAMAGGGAWSENGASLAFIVLPTWYQTNWFRLLAGAGLGGAVATFFRARVQTLERRRVAQETFSRELIQQQEAERKRIAGELHDGLGQALLVIKNTAALASDPAAAPDEIRGELAAITRLSTTALEEVRAISHALRPPELDRLGLTKALEHVVRLSAEAGVLQCAGQVEPVDGLLSTSSEIHLYRVVQECLNNVVKHARASFVEVRVWREGGRLHARVQDNGEGFDSVRPQSGAGRAGGFGLAGMAERVRLLGGELALRSQPGSGTLVEVSLPVYLAPARIPKDQ